MYIRRQPWRPRSSWLGARAGARRRGFRQDELAVVSGGIRVGDDVVMSVVGETELDDRVLAEAVVETAAQPLVPSRIDVSGLQAISALAPDRGSPSQADGALPAIAWHAFGQRNDEELHLARNSA